MSWNIFLLWHYKSAVWADSISLTASLWCYSPCSENVIQFFCTTYIVLQIIYHLTWLGSPVVEHSLGMPGVPCSMRVQVLQNEKFLEYEKCTGTNLKVWKVAKLTFNRRHQWHTGQHRQHQWACMHTIQQAPSFISTMQKFNTYHSISASINHQTTSLVSLHRRKSSFPSWKGSVLQTKLYGVEGESWKSQCVRTS